MSNTRLEGVLILSRTVKGRGWSLMDQPLSLVWLFSTCINMEDSRIGGDFYIKGTSLYVLFRDEVG